MYSPWSWDASPDPTLAAPVSEDIAAQAPYIEATTAAALYLLNRIRGRAARGNRRG